MMDNLKSAGSVTAVIIWPDFMYSDILHSFFCVVTDTKFVLSDTFYLFLYSHIYLIILPLHRSIRHSVQMLCLSRGKV